MMIKITSVSKQKMSPIKEPPNSYLQENVLVV